MSKLIVIFYSFSNALTENFSFNWLTVPIPTFSACVRLQCTAAIAYRLAWPWPRPIAYLVTSLKTNRRRHADVINVKYTNIDKNMKLWGSAQSAGMPTCSNIFVTVLLNFSIKMVEQIFPYLNGTWFLVRML